MKFLKIKRQFSSWSCKTKRSYLYFNFYQLLIDFPNANLHNFFVILLSNTEFMTDEHYMRMALQEAHEALEQGEVPIGAVVVSNDRIIGRGHNLVETLHDVTAHAEMQAITAASDTLGGKYLNECTIYVTVEPCAMCAAALGWAQIGKIVFGAPDPKKGYRKVYGDDRSPLHPKTSVSGGLLANECATLMTDFFKGLR